ncbi:hypothetical protein [Haloprofundus halophilus]|uniref:hypothetical protein n=1 Tax=Haloprofundus halophilus TaxID=2283527 RepID=UPI00130074FC|nr:hypothetical protein [Haloprofundus halophilus]
MDFLSLVHDRHTWTVRDYDTFIDQQSDDDQDQRVRQHKLDPKVEYLYKAEGGRSEVIKKFRSHATEFGDVDLLLLVDFDNDGRSAFLTELNDKLDEHYGGLLRVTANRVHQNIDMEFFNCDILNNGNIDHSFKLAAFKDDLEAATNIKKGEKRSQHRRKIWIYLEYCNRVYKDLRDFIYY